MKYKFISTQDFINKANIIYNNKYKYDKTIYLKQKEKVTITCLQHGDFQKTPYAHVIEKKECPKCSRQQNDKKRTYNTQDFINKAQKVFGNQYDYSISNYISSENLINIKCLIHGVFSQRPSDHWKKIGCKQCAIQEKANQLRYTKQQFIDLATKTHGNRYNYNNVVYIDYHTKVEIICSQHGSFWQKPAYHISCKSNCQICAKSGFSEAEITWLNSLNLSLERQKEIFVKNNKKYRLDGYDPLTHTAYEFHGDYFHGNPQIYKSNEINEKLQLTFGELYLKTKKKEQDIIDFGYNLVVKWETEIDK